MKVASAPSPCSRFRRGIAYVLVAAFACLFAQRAFAFDSTVYNIGGSQYTGDTSPQVSVDYSTGNATVTFSFSIAARQGEGFYDSGCSMTMYHNGQQCAQILGPTGLSGQDPTYNDYTGYSYTLSWSGSYQNHEFSPGDTFYVSQTMRGTQHGTTWTGGSTSGTSTMPDLGVPPNVSFNGATSYNPQQQITGSITGGNNPSQIGYAIFGLTGWKDGFTTVAEQAQITNGSSSETYTMEVYQNAYGYWSEVDTYYTITVTKLTFSPPTSSNSSATVGVGWTPSISGGGPFSGTAFCIAGITHWQTGPWTPQASDAGQTYTFWVANVEDGSIYDGTTTTDPGFSGEVLAIAGTWNVTVGQAPQTISFPNPGNQPYNSSFGVTASATSGLPVTFSISSGSASVSGNTVTLFGAAGSTVTICASQSGNGQYSAAPNAYQTITITKAGASVTLSNLNTTYNGQPQGATASTNPGGLATTITYNGSTNAPVNAGSYSVTATISDNNYQGSASGTFTIQPAGISFSWSGGPHFTYDGSTKSVSVSASPFGASFSQSGTYSASGGGQYTAYASGYGNYSGSGSYTWWIDPGSQSVVSISPITQSITARSSVTFFASGGSGSGGYIWGGAAAGQPTGSSVTVSFPSSGTYSVSVYKSGDSNFQNSNTATATITVNPYPATLSVTGTTSFGSVYRDTAAGSPMTAAQTFTLANTGDLSLTVTGVSATGNFSVTSAPSLPATLGPGATTTITVTFNPGTSVGSNTGTLSVSTTANSPSFSLSGTCLAPGIGISWF